MGKRSRSVAAIAALLLSTTVVPAACSNSESNQADEETFASAVEPIVRAKCQTCHRAGGIAPFALVTYEDVEAVGRVAKDALVARTMPPWGPFDDEGCANARKFKGDLSLTQAQIDTFVRWVDHGMPRGNTAKSPPPSTFPPGGIIDKTHTYEVAAPHVVEGSGSGELRCFPIDLGLTEDTWIAESILIPTDPRVVHHALVYLDPHREGVTKADASGSYPCFGTSDVKDTSLLLAWSPGGTSTTYGDNAGLLLPKGTHLVVQMHYHPIAQSATGRANLELKALAGRPTHAAWFVLIGNAESATNTDNSGGSRLLPGPSDPSSGPVFLIPSNAKAHTEDMEFVIPTEWKIAAVGAHMHWAGVDMKLRVERKGSDEDPECLLSTKYDFSWQRTYAYDTPLEQTPVLRAGDKLRITCTYDNTADNPYIAREMRDRRMTKPPAIRLGGQATDEMCQAIVVFIE